MKEVARELQTFNEATKNWFNNSLDHSDYYLKSNDAKKERLYLLFGNQLVRDVQQQKTIISQNFITRKEVTPAISDKGKEMTRNLEQLLLSPAIMSIDCPLETRINQNWSLIRLSGVPTIPSLTEDFVHDEAKNFDYSPITQDGQAYKYARYDIDKNPRVREYVEELKTYILGNLPSGIEPETIKTLLVRTGSSIFPELLHILNFEGRKHLNLPADKNFSIKLLTKEPYFEAERAIKTMESSVAGLSPVVESISTESKTPHLNKITDSLNNKGIDCFYLEPIGNNSFMDVPDIKKVVNTFKIAKKTDSESKKIFLVIDSTIMGGGFKLKDFFDSQDFKNINVVVIESVNKFFSYGIDKGNLGFVYGLGPDLNWVFNSLKDRIQMTGLPDFRSVLSIPLPNKKIIDERKKRFNYNTHFLAKNIFNSFKGKAKVIYPGLTNHPQYERAKKEYDFQGSIFFIQLKNIEKYEELDKLLETSKLIGKGTSYGFNKTRAEVIRRKDEYGNKIPIIFRISVGTENIREMILVYEELQGILTKVL